MKDGKKAWRYAIAALVAVLLIVVGFLANGLHLVAASTGPTSKGHPASRGPSSVGQRIGEVLLGQNPINILLIGNNARNATSPLSQGQADLMVIAHVDPQSHTVVLITVPRNVMVAYASWHDPIPKAKSAFFMGGPSLALATLSKLTGLPIRYYVVADFQGFQAAVDAVGGVTIDIKQRIYEPQLSHAVFQPGVQHLDGTQALEFVRVRQNHAGNDYRVNDFQRMQAAVDVIRAVEQQALGHLSFAEMSRLVSVWRQDVATNLTAAQITGFALNLRGDTISHVTVGSIADSMDLYGAPLPGVNAENAFEGAYYDVVPRSEIAKQLKPYGASAPDSGLPHLPAARAVSVTLADAAQGGPVATALAKAGIGTSFSSSVGTSSGNVQILYPSGDLMQAVVAARAIGDSTEIVKQAAVPFIEVLAP